MTTYAMSEQDRYMLDLIGKIDWGDAPTWITGVVAAIALRYAYRQVEGMRDQNKAAKELEESQRRIESDRLRPVVIAYFERNKTLFPEIDFVIKNVGIGTAYNVKFDFRICPEPTEEWRSPAFWKAHYLSEGIGILAPGQTISCAADDANKRNDAGWPDALYEIEISYDSITEEQFSETNIADMNMYKGSFHFVEKNIHHVAKSLESISTSLNELKNT